MRKIIFVFVILVSFISCGYESKKVNKSPTGMQMYKASEMAVLMRKMYEFNKKIKSQIINNDTLLVFPDEFNNIHTAILTDVSDRNKEFDSLSNLFLNLQSKALTKKGDSVTFYFNKSINTCISCHETRCTGPIPKIRKLLIQ